MNHDIDIVLPFKNAAKTLESCLESIASQTLGSWRLLAIDDGSADASQEIIRALARREERVCLLASGGRGLVTALNHGLAHATAPLIARMDADDVMLPGRLMAQVDFLRRNPGIGVAGCLVDTAGHSAGFRHYLEWTNTLTTPEAIGRARFIESPMVHPTVCFRRDLVEHHGGYREGHFPEDYELWLRWMEAGVKFAKVGQTLLRWIDRPDRLTRKDPRYAIESFFDIKADYLTRWLDRHNPFGRKVWVWGAGYVTRRRVRRLLKHGLVVERLVDIDPRKIGTRNQDGQVVSPAALPGPERSFVLVAVGTRGARDLIARALIDRGYEEEISFLCIA